MSGALGNYIHLYAKNYERFGTNRYGESGSFYNYCSSREFIQNKVGQIKINQDTISILKARLQANTPEKLSESQQRWFTSRQQLIDLIYQILYERSQQVSGAKRQSQIASGNAYAKRDGRTIKLSSSENWASSLNHGELMKRRANAQQKYREINSLISKINSGEQPQSDSDFNRLLKLYEDYTHLSPNENLSTIGEIEKALGQVRYKGVIGEIGGAFGEMLVAACGATADQLANKTIYEFLQSAVVGNVRTEILIDKKLIDGSQISKFLNSSQKDEAFYSLGATQDKVDVHITINDDDIFANVKSYAVESGVTPKAKLQEVSLFSTLTYLNSTLSDFGNHWLNMHTTHPDGYINIIHQADQLVKKQIAFQALSSGNPFKNSQEANVFVFINRATGDVFVESVPQLLLNKFDSFSIGDISSIHFNNNRGQVIGDRISNVLNQLHQKKIRVSLPINF